MADISNLTGLQANEPLDSELYKDAGGGRPFPPKGRYTLRAPDNFTSEAFGVAKSSGALTASIDPTIVSPERYAGTQIRFQRVSAKTYKRGDATVSQVGDYLRAAGVQFKLTGDPQQTADAIEQTAGRVYEAYLDWRLFARGHGEGGTDLVIEGMESFPQDEKGNYIPFVESKTQSNPETGEPLRLRANLSITGFVPARS